MKRLTPLVAAVLALGTLSGCDQDDKVADARNKEEAHMQAASARRPDYSGKDLMAYAPATDFSGAAPEDASRRASAMFDGATARDAVADPRFNAVPASSQAAGRTRGKRLPLTAASSERTSDLRGAVPPLPDTYDYSKSGATPGTASGAGQTLLGFAAFQLEQKFPTVAPIMSRLGWHAAPRRGSNSTQNPYRVTVHHTQGKRPMNEAEASAAVKNIQHYHMVGRGQEGKDNFDDIGYHFLIAGDGRVIEGRRAEYMGAHVRGGNEGNIGVAMMGDFNVLQPTNAQIESLTRLVTFLAVKYKKNPSDKGFLEGHQHYNNTDCPGKNMMAILDALRAKIDSERNIVVAGDTIGSENFTPLAVLGPSA